MSNTTLAQAVERLRAHSLECINNGAHVTVPYTRPGDAYAQGDVGVVCLEKLPAEARPRAAPENGQIAQGDSNGARHCVATPGVKFYDLSGLRDPLSDIAVVAECPWDLTHPEHGDYTFPPGTYQFVHQQNEEHMRVID